MFIYGYMTPTEANRIRIIKIWTFLIIAIAFGFAALNLQKISSESSVQHRIVLSSPFSPLFGSVFLSLRPISSSFFLPYSHFEVERLCYVCELCKSVCLTHFLLQADWRTWFTCLSVAIAVGLQFRTCRLRGGFVQQFLGQRKSSPWVEQYLRDRLRRGNSDDTGMVLKIRVCRCWSRTIQALFWNQTGETYLV